MKSERSVQGVINVHLLHCLANLLISSGGLLQVGMCIRRIMKKCIKMSINK
jgi:hypothetical protein